MGSGLGAALLRIVPSLRTINMMRSLQPRPLSMGGATALDLPFTRISISLSFQFTAPEGASWREKALKACAGTLRELHAMSEIEPPCRGVEPAVPLTCLPQLTRLENLYTDLTTLFGPPPERERRTLASTPAMIEDLLPCATLRKLHVFNDLVLAKKKCWYEEPSGGAAAATEVAAAADAMLEHALLRPLLAACGGRGGTRFPQLRLVSVRTPIRDGGVFAREMVRAFADVNRDIGFVMVGGTTDAAGRGRGRLGARRSQRKERGAGVDDHDEEDEVAYCE
ncbi:hypothetical protein PG994_003390 [Apiospora phragmitis]|uniref:Uncharacterized protein n=1 Tax=Apiospora phragmitis TaxID=2905665 RepID=A0ABR1VY16_9PEZI